MVSLTSVVRLAGFTRLVALARRQKIAIGGTEAADRLMTRRYADLLLEASAHRCDLRRSAGELSRALSRFSHASIRPIRVGENCK
jgi:hypothetical protein